MSTTRGSAARRGALWLATLLAACVGEIQGEGGGVGDDPGAGDGLGGPGVSVNGSRAPGAAGAAGTAGPAASATGSPAEARFARPGLRKLTTKQLGNSVRDLLGVEPPSLDLEPDTGMRGFLSIGASHAVISARGVEQFEEAARAAATAVFGREDRRAALVGCTPTAAAGDACARQFVTRFGRRAWRRPLSDGEASRYLGLAAKVAGDLGSGWAGLEYATSALLQSPNFLYRWELGERDPANPGRRRHTGYEMATRLAFFLWNSTPDDALLDEAATGSLLSEEGVRRAADRLLAAPRAQAGLGAFFSEMFELHLLEGVRKDAARFPEMTVALAAAMRDEALRSASEIVFAKKSHYFDLLTTNDTFVNTALARLYGLPAPAQSGFVRATLPENGPRAGFLGQAAFLALNAKESSTSPTMRGKFVRQTFLCQEVPSPPADADTTLPDPPAGATVTLRERLESHRANPTCAGCHGLMDPIGLAFESFDAIGKYRQTDRGLPIDPSGELDGTRFRDARELGKVLRNHSRASACLVSQLYQFATGHTEEGSEGRLVEDLTRRFAESGFRLHQVLPELVASAGFRYAASEPR